MFSEPLENLANMFAVFSGVVRVDEDVVQIDRNADIKEVAEDVIHEMLESGRCVSKTEGHNQPFKGAVASLKSSFPLIAFGDADEMVGMSEIYLGVQAGFAGSIQEVRNKRERVTILFSNVVEAAEINAET
ncbi:hypothetical protein AN958_09171 [Leucoagaricus sp. SymC.cos]|nr:hypothetical protein AN958_09171 [Leucoagaricus sp. SymC.cos]